MTATTLQGDIIRARARHEAAHAAATIAKRDAEAAAHADARIRSILAQRLEAANDERQRARAAYKALLGELQPSGASTASTRKRRKRKPPSATAPPTPAPPTSTGLFSHEAPPPTPDFRTPPKRRPPRSTRQHDHELKPREVRALMRPDTYRTRSGDDD